MAIAAIIMNLQEQIDDHILQGDKLSVIAFI